MTGSPGIQYDARHITGETRVQIALATTILSNWNYPRPLFSAIPSFEERAPFLLWTRLSGFDGIDIADSWMDWHSMSEDDLHTLRDQLDDVGLACCALNPYRCIVVKHPDAARNEEKLFRSVEVASLLGATYLNLALSLPFPARMTDRERADRQTTLARGEDYSDADFEATAEKLRRLADRAATRNVHLSIELHDDGMTDRSEFALRLDRMVDRPNVGVNPDLQNGFRVPYPTEDWREALLAMAPRTNFWHVKSCTRRFVPETGRYQSSRASLIDGDIDYRWALTKLHEHDFDGWISIESGGGDSLHTIEEDHNYLRSLIREWLPLMRL
ncbi:MAG: sugar phosphate isomerase/epimerase [Chloroflexota bacterium]|nr:MAG: sugar phosphate isomerase/epimerase [Chloroflexota bacterium]